MTNKRPDHEKERRDALRALDRVQDESETIIGSTFQRMAKRAGDHFGANDKASGDPIEVWGTRIGRFAGPALFVVWLIYMFFTYW
ncbi:MAG: hypothetical protein HWE23_09340 [Rhodobacteraceae bacterium]|nr:hypothetical protein [Paracoccaceae bacterium]